MKKEELKNKAQLTRDKAKDRTREAMDKTKEVMDKTKDKVKEKVEEGRTYVKNNPEKSKAILAGVGAFLIAVLAFMLGRKTKNGKDDK